LAAKPGGWRPLVYCWRGGQRSGSFASILSQIGWRAQVVEGGYQTYRRLVFKALYEDPLPHPLILLDGNTGTAKTDLLARLAARGVQVIDLEGMARHRGSLLGAVAGGQPGQKAFESAVAVAFARLDPARPVVVEAESSKIGDRIVPPVLWAAMRAAPRLVIDAPLDARADYLVTSYADMVADPQALLARLQPLRELRGKAVVDAWTALLAAGDHKALAAALMAQHYDAAYAKSRATTDHRVLADIHVARLDDAGRDEAADRLATAVAAYRPAVETREPAGRECPPRSCR
jgi:tRNA 2-selenouridine synthase